MGVIVAIAALRPTAAGRYVLSPDDLDFQLHFAIAKAFNTSIRTTHIPHKVEILRLQTLAQPLIDKRYRDGELSKKVDAHSGRTELGYEAAIDVENQTLPYLVAGIAVLRLYDLSDDRV